jgi:hypothetical protein
MGQGVWEFQPALNEIGYRGLWRAQETLEEVRKQTTD